jgi:hypothetical protein
MPARRQLLARALALSAAAAAPRAIAADDDARAATPTATAGSTLRIGGGSFHVSFTGGETPRADVLAALTAGAEAVTAYYGRFPVPRVRIVVEGSGRGVHGTTYGTTRDGPLVHLRIGARVSPTALRESWVITHEFVHLAFPDQRGAHRWIEEGLATWVEPIARVQSGALPAQAVWRDAVRGMPNGLPRDGDRGLDGTPTWGRTYWGGALFCMLADLEMRRRSGNRHGLQHALRGIVAAGGNIAERWPLARALATADATVGGDVLARQYAAMGSTPVHVDLAALWQRLGVAGTGSAITFDDTAPEAALRRAITTPPV